MENEDDMMKALQEELNKKMNEINSSPVEEMDNLSPTDMYHILNFTFEEVSPIGFKKTISNAVLDEIPFLTLFRSYLTVILESKELKLTTRGNLPRKVCLDLYGKGLIKEDPIESGFVKLSKEADSVVLQNLKIFGELTGITKKRNNKISLTKKGMKLFKPDQKEALFKALFITHCKRFNLGYHDGYPQEVGVQKTFGFTLYLLLRYGNEKRKLDFYTKKSLLAFPFELNNFKDSWSTPEKKYHNCYQIRIFRYFLKHYNFVDYNPHNFLLKEDNSELQITSLFAGVFELRKDKFCFKKNEHQA